MCTVQRLSRISEAFPGFLHVALLVVCWYDISSALSFMLLVEHMLACRKTATVVVRYVEQARFLSRLFVRLWDPKLVASHTSHHCSFALFIFRVLTPLRHVVLMSHAKGYPMYQLRSGEMGHPDVVYRQCVEMIVRLARHGLIHCDFNEFNMLVDEEERLTLIDFPQMVSTRHANAEDMFDR